MRQGDGSDLLGPGNPRNAEIGIIYVEPQDTRQDILTAITTRDMSGCKQIAIVLHEQSKVFRQPVDFDGLKNMRRQLRNADLIFIASSGSGAADFARQRQFRVYSTLESYKTEVQQESAADSGRRGKSNPGLAGFSGSRKTRPDSVRGPQARGKQSRPASRPIPQAQPMPSMPLSPLADLPTISLDQSGSDKSLPAAQMESEEDDLLYAPPGNPPASTPQDSSTPALDSSSKPLQGGGPGIIAFPLSMPSTPKTSTKLPAVQPSQQGSSTKSTGKTPAVGPRGSVPLGNAPGTGTGKLATPQAFQNQQAVSSSQDANSPDLSSVPVQPNNPNRRGSGSGKTAAIVAGTAGAGAALGTGVLAGSAGSSPAQSVQASGQVGTVSGPAAGGGGGSGMGPRPSGLTPLPPPRSRMQKRRRNGRRLLLVGLIVLLCLLVGGIVYAQMGKVGGLTNPFKVSAQVTITPANKLEHDNFVLSALPTGTPNPAQRQIQARNLDATSPKPLTAQGTSTGVIKATQAMGQLLFQNSTRNGITVGVTTITGADGVQVTFNQSVFVPATGTASVTVNAYAIIPGSKGNIPALDIAQACCVSGIAVKNINAFYGGQDPQTVVQKSDIDAAAKPLETTLSQNIQVSLKQKVQANERVVDNSFSCTPTVTSDHQLKDPVPTFTVKVTEECTEEVYDYDSARSMGSTLLLSEASTDAAITPQHALDGQIQTAVLSATIVSTTGQVSVTVEAQGLWVYQFTTQMQQNLKQQLIKLTKTAAQNVLSHTTGVAQAQIMLSNGNTLPDNTSDITLTITTLPGAQPISTGTVTPSTPGSGSGSGIPTESPGAKPGSTPTIGPCAC